MRRADSSPLLVTLSRPPAGGLGVIFVPLFRLSPLALERFGVNSMLRFSAGERLVGDADPLSESRLLRLTMIPGLPSVYG